MGKSLGNHKPRLAMQMHPVDDFFTSYVDELARQSTKRQAEPGVWVIGQGVC
jgi:hypothetical protein